MKPVIRLAAIVVSCALPGLPSQAATPSKPAAPIKVGAISSLTAVAAFPESAKATRAYFELINALGGIHGRKLVLLAEDDKSDPKLAAEAAKRLVDGEGVVAMVGSASTTECGVNADFYVRRGVASIQGTGVDPGCFNSPNISPVNTGPYVGTSASLQFASEIRGRSKVCAVLMAIPGMRPGYDEAVAIWKRNFKKELHLYDPDYPPGAPTAPFVKKVVDAKCEAVLFLGLEPWIPGWIKDVKASGAKGIDWMFLTPAYTSDIAQKVGADGDGMFAMSEFLPWSSRALDLTDWRDTMKRHKVPLTSFSQGGYLAAQIFVSVLKKIPGEITRESVLAAFHELKTYESPLVGTPYAFGPDKRHNSNHAIIPMVLRDSQWRIANPDWIIVPTK